MTCTKLNCTSSKNNTVHVHGCCRERRSARTRLHSISMNVFYLDLAQAELWDGAVACGNFLADITGAAAAAQNQPCVAENVLAFADASFVMLCHSARSIKKCGPG